MNQHEGGTPFREPLKQSQFNRSNLLELSKNPDKLVREQFLNSDNSGEAIQFYRDARDAFYKMRDEFDVPVPDIDLILGLNDKGEKRMFMVVDKIEGKSISSMMEISNEIAKLIDDVYCNVLRATFDAYKKRQPVWLDFSDDQFVYGHKMQETENKIYLVDVEPIAGPDYHTFVYSHNDDYDAKFARLMKELVPSRIRYMEDYRLNEIKLTKIQTMLDEIKNYINQQEK